MIFAHFFKHLLIVAVGMTLACALVLWATYNHFVMGFLVIVSFVVLVLGFIGMDCHYRLTQRQGEGDRNE